MKLTELKTEVGQILDRYPIPMDDKSFIIDKIEGQVSGLAEQVVTHIKNERAKDKEQVESIQGQARQAVHEMLNKSQGAVRQAYQLGVKEGLSQAPEPDSIAKNWFFWFQLAVGAGVITLAGFVIYWQFFKGQGRRDE